MNQKLASKRHWNDEWSDFRRNQKNPVKRLFKKIFGANVFEKYHEKVFWELAKQHLPNKNVKLIEIGCAPAALLVKFKEKFNYDVYGLEYSRSGYEVSRGYFLKAGIAEGNLIQADFFSKKFQKQYRESFDIVYSRGFIEHFSSPQEAISRHLNLLKKNGILFVTIPNFSGVNGRLLNFFSPGLLAKHNTDIMRLDEFRSLFPNSIKELYCNYFSPFNFFYFSSNTIWKRYLLLVLQFGQYLIEQTVWKIVKPKYHNKSCLQLAFIGIKKDNYRDQ